MNFIKNYFKNRNISFWLAFGGGVIAVISSVVYMIAYQATAKPDIDRVYKIIVFALMLAGGVIAIAAEGVNFRFARIIPVILYSIGAAYHFTETAYPMADVITGVPFFGGSFSLALVFAILFIIPCVISVVCCFMDNKGVKA